MTPPFDADRAANNELESQDLGGVQFPEQEQEFPAAIDTPEEQSDEEEQEQEQESSDASLSGATASALRPSPIRDSPRERHTWANPSA